MSNDLVQRFLEATSMATFDCREKKPQTTIFGMLVDMLECFKHGVTLEKLIEDQMVEALARTDDFGTLMNMWEGADGNSRREQLIEERMGEVYEATVSAITNVDSIPQRLQMSMEIYIEHTVWPSWLDITVLIHRLNEIR